MSEPTFGDLWKSLDWSAAEEEEATWDADNPSEYTHDVSGTISMGRDKRTTAGGTVFSQLGRCLDTGRSVSTPI